MIRNFLAAAFVVAVWTFGIYAIAVPTGTTAIDSHYQQLADALR